MEKYEKVLTLERFVLLIDAWDSFPCGYTAWFYNHFIGFISHTQSLEHQGLRFCICTQSRIHILPYQSFLFDGSDSVGAFILCMSLILFLGPAGWPRPVLLMAMAEVHKDKKKYASPSDLGSALAYCHFCLILLAISHKTSPKSKDETIYLVFQQEECEVSWQTA